MGESATRRGPISKNLEKKNHNVKKNTSRFVMMCQNLRSMHTGFKKLELHLEALPAVDKPDCIVCQEFHYNLEYVLFCWKLFHPKEGCSF